MTNRKTNRKMRSIQQTEKKTNMKAQLGFKLHLGSATIGKRVVVIVISLG